LTLLSRLVAPVGSEDKLPVHQFMAAIAEFRRGAPGVTANSIAAAFDLDSSELTALTNWYVGQVLNNNVNREEVHDVLLLGEGGQYTLTQVRNRLGSELG